MFTILDHLVIYDNGILHRDISNGNILICDNDTEPRGMLIDYDNAKHTDQFLALHTGTLSANEESYVRTSIEMFHYNINSEIWKKAAQYFERLDYTTGLMGYLGLLWNDRPLYLQTIETWTTKSLNWPSNVRSIYSTQTFLTHFCFQFRQCEPDFSRHVVREGLQRTVCLYEFELCKMGYNYLLVCRELCHL